MTTALQIIDRAYGLLGFKAAGEDLSADDASYGLDALNGLVDLWNTQAMSIVSVSEVVANVSGASATVGPGLTFDTPRPIRLEAGGFTRAGGIDYPLEVIDREAYAAIALKTVSSTFPQCAYYDATLPSGTVYFHPVPAASVSVHLAFQTALSEFADLATEYDLAPGYRKALEFSLAEDLAPGIRPLDPAIVKRAQNARRVIRRTNVEVPALDAVGGDRFNVYVGQ